MLIEKTRPGFGADTAEPMELTYAEICVPGPVRSNNEDHVGFWQPATAEDRREIGAIAVMADGVGGNERGRNRQRPGRAKRAGCVLHGQFRTGAAQGHSSSI